MPYTELQSTTTTATTATISNSSTTTKSFTSSKSAINNTEFYLAKTLLIVTVLVFLAVVGVLVYMCRKKRNSYDLNSTASKKPQNEISKPMKIVESVQNKKA